MLFLLVLLNDVDDLAAERKSCGDDQPWPAKTVECASEGGEYDRGGGGDPQLRL